MPPVEKAVTDLHIPIEEPFHCAKNDAYYTAKVFQEMNRKKLSDMYSIDYYHYPTCEEEEITSQHINYSEYITRTFKNKSEALNDKNITINATKNYPRRLNGLSTIHLLRFVLENAGHMV